MTGAAMIAAERKRQIDVEGWTADHDAGHKRCELVAAAVNYAALAEFIAAYGRTDGQTYYHGCPPSREFPWPWHRSWWKPNYTDPIRNLVKAGALIAAEIDRLVRAERSAVK